MICEVTALRFFSPPFGLPQFFGHFFGLDPVEATVHESRVAAIPVPRGGDIAE